MHFMLPIGEIKQIKRKVGDVSKMPDSETLPRSEDDPRCDARTLTARCTSEVPARSPSA